MNIDEYHEHMKSDKYNLEKEIGYYLMYSYIYTHHPKRNNIYSETKHYEVMKNLYDNFDNLPNHIDKCLLKRDFLKEGKVLEYNEHVYSNIVKTFALYFSENPIKLDEKS
jgi:hypothetical protein